MTRLSTVAVLLVASLFVACGDEDSEPPIYLAMGDSLSVGVGASDPTAGFVPIVAAALEQDFEGIVTRNIAVGGEGSGPVRSEGQLDAALTLLRERNGNDTNRDDIVVVTLSVGGNDITVVTEVCLQGPTPECQLAIGTALQTFAVNFNAILGELRAAAGDETRIAVMTYFNAAAHPECAVFPQAELAEAVLEGAPQLGLEAGLNDLIRAIASQHSVEVAETHGLVDASGMQPDCRHANDSGYQTIAAQFLDVLVD